MRGIRAAGSWARLVSNSTGLSRLSRLITSMYQDQRPGWAARLVGDAQVHAGVVGQASPLQGVEAAEVDGIDERAGGVPRRDQPPARVLVGRYPHPDRRGCRGSRWPPAR